MKQGILILGIAVLLVGMATPAQAKKSDMTLGLGLFLGSPLGANMKYRMDDVHAIDVTMGFGFVGYRNFHIHADYLYHWRVVANKDLDMDLHLGVGPVVEIYRGTVRFPVTHDETRALFAIRVPIGLDFMIRKVVNRTPIDFFIEFAPGLQLFDGVWYYFDGGIGFRYYFF